MNDKAENILETETRSSREQESQQRTLQPTERKTLKPRAQNIRIMVTWEKVNQLAACTNISGKALGLTALFWRIIR